MTSHTRWIILLLLTVLLVACAAPPAALEPDQEATPAGQAGQEHGEEHSEADHAQALPELTPLALGEGEKMRVVATTNILGDVVRQVGGDLIEQATLLPVGADPHSYNAAPADLRTLSDAHVIFVVGEGIEESLEDVLSNREGESPLIAVNTGIELLEVGEAETQAEHEEHTEGHTEEHAEEEAATEAEEHAEGEEHHHHGLDPHTWMAVPNVIHWVETIEHTLSELDPANAGHYAANAAAYIAQLEELDAEIQSAVAAIPVENRKLVTDHETFGYFAAHYGFEVIGTVIPSFSTLAAPSAQELAALQEQIASAGVKAIFVGSTVNPDLGNQIASDVGVPIVPLYADSLSAADGPAATYVELMRYNVNTIVEALK